MQIKKKEIISNFWNNKKFPFIFVKVIFVIICLNAIPINKLKNIHY